MFRVELPLTEHERVLRAKLDAMHVGQPVRGV